VILALEQCAVFNGNPNSFFNAKIHKAERGGVELKKEGWI